MSKNDNLEIKPCPFCGGKPDIYEIGNVYTAKRSIEIVCTTCFVKRKVSTPKGHQTLEWLENTSLELWNKRTDSTKLYEIEYKDNGSD